MKDEILLDCYTFHPDVYNNFKPVAFATDCTFGTYQFVYFDAARGVCKNARGSKTLTVICFKNSDLNENKFSLPFDLKYFILIGVFLVTFTLWSVATKCGNIRSHTRSCCINDVDNDVE